MTKYQLDVPPSRSAHLGRGIGGKPMAMGANAPGGCKGNSDTIDDVCYIWCHTKPLVEL
jgi:hypothetical protein